MPCFLITIFNSFLMFRYLLGFCLLLFSCFYSQISLAQIQTISNPCEVFGVVYVQTIPSRADFLVYVEQDEYLANLRVFKEINKLLADRAGLWHFVEKEGFADFSVCFVEDRAKADFIIFFTDKEFFAGCVR